MFLVNQREKVDLYQDGVLDKEALSERLEAMRNSENLYIATAKHDNTTTIGKWREEMCEWSYTVIDHCNFEREIVAVSISMLDRFLGVTPCSKDKFKLVALTTLFMAIKLYSVKKVKIESMAELSNGSYSASHIESMEKTILATICWRVHPPTPISYANHFLCLLPPVHGSVIKSLTEVVAYLVELSVCDSYFNSHSPSSIAAAAIIDAISILNFPSKTQVLMGFTDELREHFPSLNVTSDQFALLLKRLMSMYWKSMEFLSRGDDIFTPGAVSSPTSVSEARAVNHVVVKRKKSRRASYL